MKRKRYTEEQIIAILKEHEAGMKTADLCRKHGIICHRQVGNHAGKDATSWRLLGLRFSVPLGDAGGMIRRPAIGNGLAVNSHMPAGHKDLYRSNAFVRIAGPAVLVCRFDGGSQG